jgi:hypothetical protein
MAPDTLPERGGSQRQVEAAEHEVRDAEVDDEHCGGVPDLQTSGALVKHSHHRAVSTIIRPSTCSTDVVSNEINAINTEYPKISAYILKYFCREREIEQ